MPLAPAIGSDELTAEIGEVYIQALLRDVEFTQYACGDDIVVEPNSHADEALRLLNELDWFNNQGYCDLTPAEASRKRANLRRQNAFRIGILEEQKLTYGENFSMTVPLYDGGAIRI